MPLIQLKTVIDAPLELVFDLSRSVDIHTLSTKESKEEAIAGKTSGLMELNDEVTWRAKHFGIYQKLSSKVTEFEKPHYFVDEMTKGIFKSFRHEHQFEQKADRTVMIDLFNYTSPLGLLGKFADILFLKRYMTQFLIRRNETIKQYAKTLPHSDLRERTQYNNAHTILK